MSTRIVSSRYVISPHGPMVEATRYAVRRCWAEVNAALVEQGLGAEMCRVEIVVELRATVDVDEETEIPR